MEHTSTVGILRSRESFLLNGDVCGGTPPGWGKSQLQAPKAFAETIEKGYCPYCCSILRCGRVWFGEVEAALSFNTVRIPPLPVRIESIPIREESESSSVHGTNGQLLLALRLNKESLDPSENRKPLRKNSVGSREKRRGIRVRVRLHDEKVGQEQSGVGKQGTGESVYVQAPRYRFRLREIYWPGTNEPYWPGTNGPFWGRNPNSKKS